MRYQRAVGTRRDQGIAILRHPRVGWRGVVASSVSWGTDLFPVALTTFLEDPLLAVARLQSALPAKMAELGGFGVVERSSVVGNLGVIEEAVKTALQKLDGGEQVGGDAGATATSQSVEGDHVVLPKNTNKTPPLQLAVYVSRSNPNLRVTCCNYCVTLLNQTWRSMRKLRGEPDVLGVDKSSAEQAEDAVGEGAGHDLSENWLGEGGTGRTTGMDERIIGERERGPLEYNYGQVSEMDQYNPSLAINPILGEEQLLFEEGLFPETYEEGGGGPSGGASSQWDVAAPISQYNGYPQQLGSAGIHDELLTRAVPDSGVFGATADGFYGSPSYEDYVGSNTGAMPPDNLVYGDSYGAAGQPYYDPQQNKNYHDVNYEGYHNADFSEDGVVPAPDHPTTDQHLPPTLLQDSRPSGVVVQKTVSSTGTTAAGEATRPSLGGSPRNSDEWIKLSDIDIPGHNLERMTNLGLGGPLPAEVESGSKLASRLSTRSQTAKGSYLGATISGLFGLSRGAPPPPKKKSWNGEALDEDAGSIKSEELPVFAGPSRPKAGVEEIGAVGASQGVGGGTGDHGDSRTSSPLGGRGAGATSGAPAPAAPSRPKLATKLRKVGAGGLQGPPPLGQHQQEFSSSSVAGGGPRGNEEAAPHPTEWRGGVDESNGDKTSSGGLGGGATSSTPGRAGSRSPPRSPHDLARPDTDDDDENPLSPRLVDLQSLNSGGIPSPPQRTGEQGDQKSRKKLKKKQKKQLLGNIYKDGEAPLGPPAPAEHSSNDAAPRGRSAPARGVEDDVVAREQGDRNALNVVEEGLVVGESRPPRVSLSRRRGRSVDYGAPSGGVDDSEGGGVAASKKKKKILKRKSKKK